MPLFPQKPIFKDQVNNINYIPDSGLVHAVNVALLLQQPLLLTGEPGVGKTELARYLADDLDLEPPLKFETKSTSQSRDLFYYYDALGRFHARDSGTDTSPEHFIHFNALGKAILLSNPKHSLYPLINPIMESQLNAQRSVVLIDEVDKAPRDFPNDILNEINELYYRIPEINNERIAIQNENLRPIVIITSNSERDLPDAFLRRCVYYNIPFPDSRRLTQIVMAHLGDQLKNKETFLDDALDIFYQLREPRNALVKKPTTAELLGWIKVIRHYDNNSLNPIRQNSLLLSNTLSALVKTADDQNKANGIIQQWIKKQNL